MAAQQSEKCYSHLTELDSAMRDALGPDGVYFLLGGPVTGAIGCDASTIDPVGRCIIATAESDLPVRRADGSTRDVDILVPQVMSHDVGRRIRDTVADAIGGGLLVSVFGCQTYVPHLSAVDRLRLSASSWVSRRTIDGTGQHRYELYPLVQPVQAGTYDPWRLWLPGTAERQAVSILHPVGHMLAYRMRSIGGARPKDAEKYQKMQRRLLPAFLDEIQDGPFKQWREFGDNISKLAALGSVAEGLRPETNLADRIAFAIKSKLSSAGEANPRVVSFFQTDRIQEMLKRLIGNE